MGRSAEICDVAECRFDRQQVITNQRQYFNFFSLDYYWKCVLWCIAVFCGYFTYEFRFEFLLIIRHRFQWLLGFAILGNYVLFGEGLLPLLKQFWHVLIQVLLKVLIDNIRSLLEILSRFVTHPAPAPNPPRAQQPAAVMPPQRLPVTRQNARRLRSGRIY